MLKSSRRFAGDHDDARRQMKHEVAAYGEWAERLAASGYTADLLTFKFDPLSGSESAVHAAMLREAERVYATFITHVVRKPAAISSRGRLPIWLSAPDYPVFKRKRERFFDLADVIINDGAHVHVIALTPTVSRLAGESLTDHFTRRHAVYVREGKSLREIHVEPITHQLAEVVAYALKAISSGRVDKDELLILPRTLHELDAKDATSDRASAALILSFSRTGSFPRSP